MSLTCLPRGLGPIGEAVKLKTHFAGAGHTGEQPAAVAGAPARGGTRTACLSGVLLGRIRGGLLCTDGWDRGLTVMGRVCTHAHAHRRTHACCYCISNTKLVRTVGPDREKPWEQRVSTFCGTSGPDFVSLRWGPEFERHRFTSMAPDCSPERPRGRFPPRLLLVLFRNKRMFSPFVTISCEPGEACASLCLFYFWK